MKELRLLFPFPSPSTSINLPKSGVLNATVIFLVTFPALQVAIVAGQQMIILDCQGIVTDLPN